MLFNIAHAANIIDYLFLKRIIIKRIHCKVSAHYILFNCSKLVTYRAFFVRTESTNFKNL